LGNEYEEDGRKTEEEEIPKLAFTVSGKPGKGVVSK